MEAVVFVPGILGTKLLSADGEEIWPPTWDENIAGYKRTDQLLADDVRPGEIIRSVYCYDFYKPVLQQLRDLGFAKNGNNKSLHEFPYDWRLDLETTADSLELLLRQVEADGADTIAIVAHSMGGLIARLALERKGDADETWKYKVDKFISIAVPHRGAPLALARVLGLDTAFGISKEDFKRIGNDERYPSGYQLLPAPGEDAIWDQTDGGLNTLNIFDDSTIVRLGLNPKMLERTKFVHTILDANRKPTHVRYFHFAGTGHETMTRINITKNRNGPLAPTDYVPTLTPDGGDGTVPLMSQLDGSQQRQTVVNEHAHVFRGSPFKRVFYRLFGSDIGLALEDVDRPSKLTVQVAEPVIEADRDFLATISADPPATDIRGKLVLERVNKVQQSISPSSDVAQITGPTGQVDRISIPVPRISEPGYYRLSFKGKLEMEEPAVFAVIKFGMAP
jgi:pimeloyl-ACP methyl ester carboxylesterase